MSDSAPAIEARDLSFGYDGARVLNAVNLSLQPGGLLTISGPNGSGKTTLLYLLSGILKQSSGEVRIHGKPISEYSPILLAREIALMPQYLPYTPWLTAGEIVEMGMYSIGPSGLQFARRFGSGISGTKLASIRAMELADVAHLESRLSGELSGGELRRVHLARVLAQNSRILLLDEPASDLDIHHQSLLLEIVRESTCSGKSVLFVTHDLNFATILGGDMALLDGGRSVAAGSPDKIISEDILSKIYPGGFRITTDLGGSPLVFPVARDRSSKGGSH